MDYNEAAEAVDTALFEARGDAATANENAAAAVETANAVYHIPLPTTLFSDFTFPYLQC